MRGSIAGARFTGHGFLAVINFWALAGLANASTDPASPDQAHYENAWVFFSLFALVGLNAWMYWHLWKNRASEEEPKPEVLIPTPRTITHTQALVHRKRTSRERVKVPV